MFDVKETLKTLCLAKGPSGYEDRVADLVRETWEPLVDDFARGNLGDVIGIKRGAQDVPDDQRRKILLAGHMDEIGLMVTQIEGQFIRVGATLGGIDIRVMPGQSVTVFGKRELPGYVGSVPPHVMSAEQRKNYPRLKDLVVDVGLPADALAELVRVGDVVTFDVPFTELQGRRVASKSVDNRASVTAITACLDHLQGRRHHWDVLAAATTREEVGLYGAAAVTFQTRPDVAIALDVTFASQPGADGPTFELGGGPVLAVGPGYHPKLVEALRKAAKRLEMRVQIEPDPRPGGTDTAALQVSREGVPAALIGLPLRNMHTPVELIDLGDIERAGRLLAEFIGALDADFLQTIEWDPDEDGNEDDNEDGNENDSEENDASEEDGA